MSKMNFYISRLNLLPEGTQGSHAESYSMFLGVQNLEECSRDAKAFTCSRSIDHASGSMFFEIWCAWWSFVFLQLNNCRIPFMFLHVVPCATFGGRVWHFGPIEPRTISNHAALCFVAVNDATFAMQFHETWTKQSHSSSPSSPGQRTGWVPQVRDPDKKMSKTLQRTHGRKESHLRWVDTGNDNNAVCVENSILFLFSFLLSLFRCQLTWECFHSTFDSPIWNICFNFVCLMLQLICNHDAIFFLVLPSPPGPNGRRYWHNLALGPPPWEEVESPPSIPSPDERPTGWIYHEGAPGRPSWIWEASGTRIKSCARTNVATCFSLARLIEGVSPSTDNPNSLSHSICKLQLLTFLMLGLVNLVN